LRHSKGVPVTSGLPSASDISLLALRDAMCHVWTAPSWQELFSRFAALVGAAMCSAF